MTANFFGTYSMTVSISKTLIYRPVGKNNVILPVSNKKQAIDNLCPIHVAQFDIPSCLMSISLLSFGSIHIDFANIRKKNYTVQMEQILEGKKASKVDEYFYCLLFCRQCQYVLTCPVSIHFSKERKKRKFSKTERPAIVDLWHDMQVFSSLLTISSDEYIETLKENTDKSKVLFFSFIF